MNSIPTFPDPPYADYESPRRTAGPLSRMLPSAAFYSRVSRTVFKAAFMAKRGKYSDLEWFKSSLRIRDAFEKTGAHVSVKGTANLANLKEPCVIIGNHMSTAETFLMASMVLPFRPVTFVVKQALVEYPVFKHVMLSRNPIVVGRVNPRDDLKAVLQGGKERLEAGTSIVIFPQKTRTVEFERESFNTIGVKLAKRAGVPVIPLALKTNAWSNGKLLKDYGPFRPQEPVHFAFGEPLRIEGSDREAHDAVIRFIESHLREWGVMK